MQLISGPFTRYRVDRTLGTGPDGPVYRALAERLGARPVAMRRLSLAAGPARARLRRDAETVAALGHPALAVVTDIVEVDERHVLVASTLGTHGSLADRLAGGPLPVEEAIPLVTTLGDALAATHALGLAHGRVRATNVVFADDGPVLCDLAQAGALGRDATPTGDVADLVQLAAALVDGSDRSPRAAAYRAVCRSAAGSLGSPGSAAGLAGLVAACAHVEAAGAPPPPPPPPRAATATEPRGRHPDPTVGSASAGLVVGTSLLVGTTVGALTTLLPVL